jgi:hypothetical protein
LTIDRQLHLSAPDGLPEIYVERVLQVASGLGCSWARLLAAEKLAEKVAEAAPGERSPFRFSLASTTFAVEEIRKIKAAESHSGARLIPSGARATPIGIKSDLVVHLPLFRIAENIVGLLDGLEALLGSLIARIQVGMVFAREPPVGLTDIVLPGVSANT